MDLDTVGLPYGWLSDVISKMTSVDILVVNLASKVRYSAEAQKKIYFINTVTVGANYERRYFGWWFWNTSR